MHYRRLRKIEHQLLLCLFCWFVLLVFYEAPQKLYEVLHIEAPLWLAADKAEKGTKYQRRTGITLVDRTLHEAQEASFFYDRATKKASVDSVDGATTRQRKAKGNGTRISPTFGSRLVEKFFRIGVIL